MPKTTVDELLTGARKDRLFEREYQSPRRRIQRAMSEALFQLRKSENLTQAQLAARAGWQQPYVARIERGDAQMVTALEGLEAFANATGTSAVVLFVDRETATVRAKVPLGEAPAKFAIKGQLAPEPAPVERLASDVVGVARVNSVKDYQIEIERITEEMERRIAELRGLTLRASAESMILDIEIAEAAVPAAKR